MIPHSTKPDPGRRYRTKWLSYADERQRPVRKAQDPLACDDPIAARRYDYARAAAEDGDWGAAAEVFEQAAEQAPGWAPAWFALGEARERLGDVDGAAKALRAALALDPTDALGAAPRLALIGCAANPTALPEAYIARLFDGYAPRFDVHLTEKLNYRGPALIVEALDLVAPGRRFAAALDIGCGTGLMGEAVRARVDRLTGVDLSPGMVARARERGLYDALEAADATAYLTRAAQGAFDCILAADALCYIGDLGPIFSAGRRTLANAGLFACSIEVFEGEGFRLRPTMRFAHARAYVDATARQAGFVPLIIRSASTRREAGREAPGLICVFGVPVQGAASGVHSARPG
jgi:predicted TPR repeat methyltransferase